MHDMQGLRNSRKLAKGESDLRAGNGARVSIVAIRTYVLNLLSGLCLNLDNCFYVSALTKNIIYVSYLNKKGFYINFSSNGCYIMLNDVFYVGRTLSNGIYTDFRRSNFAFSIFSLDFGHSDFAFSFQI